MYNGGCVSEENMRLLRLNFGSVEALGEVITSSISRLAYYWPVTWRGLGAMILGVLLAKWCWIFFAPHVIYTAAMPDRASASNAGQLFGIAQSLDKATQGVALPNVQLLGVFAAGPGKRGFAILKIEGKRQMGLAEGEEVSAGTKLLSVHDDYVLLERSGVQQRVNLENKYSGTLNKFSPSEPVAKVANSQTTVIPQTDETADDSGNAYVKEVVERSLANRIRQLRNQ
jgi:hypothetical protein